MAPQLRRHQIVTGNACRGNHGVHEVAAKAKRSHHVDTLLLRWDSRPLDERFHLHNLITHLERRLADLGDEWKAGPYT
jgi:hypothetical protein